MDASTVTLVVVVLLLVAVGAFLFTRRSKQLKQRFGPEYERTVSKTGSRFRAESELEERQKRHDHLRIRSLHRLQSKTRTDSSKS